jgi:hypothetical protein
LRSRLAADGDLGKESPEGARGHLSSVGDGICLARRETFGVLLRSARRSRRWGLRRAAERLDDTVGPEALASWENGVVLPPMRTLFKLSNVLGIPGAELFEVVDRYQALQYSVFPFP